MPVLEHLVGRLCGATPLHHDEPGMVVAVAGRDVGAQTQIFCCGSADLENAVALAPHTRFDVGSVAKQFTCLTLLTQLRGPEDLLRPLGGFLPQFKHLPITLEDLCDHRSGLRSYDNLMALAGAREFDFWAQKDVLGLIARQQEFPPTQDRDFYSNSNYVLLAEVVRALGGAPLAAVAEVALTRPAGMSDTRFVADPRTVIDHRARSYTAVGGNGGRGYAVADRSEAVVGPHGLWSTAHDLVRWGQILDEGEIFAPWVRRLLATPPTTRSRYRLGRQWRRGATGEVVGHAGDRHGFRSAVWSSPRGVAVVLGNSDRIRASSLALALLDEAQPAYRGDDGQASEQAGSPSGMRNRALSGVANGRYWSTDSGTIYTLHAESPAARVTLASAEEATTLAWLGDVDDGLTVRPAPASRRDGNTEPSTPVLEIADTRDGRILTELVPLPQGRGIPRPGAYVSPEYGLRATVTVSDSEVTIVVGRSSWSLPECTPGCFGRDGLLLTSVDHGIIRIRVPRVPDVRFVFEP